MSVQDTVQSVTPDLPMELCGKTDQKTASVSMERLSVHAENLTVRVIRISTLHQDSNVLHVEVRHCLCHLQCRQSIEFFVDKCDVSGKLYRHGDPMNDGQHNCTCLV